MLAFHPILIGVHVKEAVVVVLVVLLVEALVIVVLSDTKVLLSLSGLEVLLVVSLAGLVVVVGISSSSVATSIGVGVAAELGLGLAGRGSRLGREDFWDLFLYEMRLQGLLSHGPGTPLPGSRGRVALAIVLSGRIVVTIGPVLSLGGKTVGGTAASSSSAM